MRRAWKGSTLDSHLGAPCRAIQFINIQRTEYSSRRFDNQLLLLLGARPGQSPLTRRASVPPPHHKADQAEASHQHGIGFRFGHRRYRHRVKIEALACAEFIDGHRYQLS